MQTTDDLLDERQRTHGDFADNAAISQSLKRLFRAAPGWQAMTAIQQEAFDAIALKMSRCLSGSVHIQHVEDIVGYARLMARELSDVR